MKFFQGILAAGLLAIILYGAIWAIFVITTKKAYSIEITSASCVPNDMVPVYKIRKDL